MSQHSLGRKIPSGTIKDNTIWTNICQVMYFSSELVLFWSVLTHFFGTLNTFHCQRNLLWIQPLIMKLPTWQHLKYSVREIADGTLQDYILKVVLTVFEKELSLHLLTEVIQMSWHICLLELHLNQSTRLALICCIVTLLWRNLLCLLVHYWT